MEEVVKARDLDSEIPMEVRPIPLENHQKELFARKICDGMPVAEAYRMATGKTLITDQAAQRQGAKWTKDVNSRVAYLLNERAKSFIKAEDDMKKLREKAARNRLSRPPVDVSTFEGRKQFFQDVCDDYHLSDGPDVGEAINAVKELMKIHGDFTRKEDEVAKSDPAMVMAVIARAHLESCLTKTPEGKIVMDMVGAARLTKEIRKYFGLDYVNIILQKEGINISDRSEEVVAAEKAAEEKPVPQEEVKVPKAVVAVEL